MVGCGEGNDDVGLHEGGDIREIENGYAWERGLRDG